MYTNALPGGMDVHHVDAWCLCQSALDPLDLQL